MSVKTKIICCAGILLLAYGFLCRAIGFYFFWDSKIFGWIVIAVGLVIYLTDLIRLRKEKGIRTIWLKILVGVILFGFIMFGIVTFMLKNSEPYQVAVNYLESNAQLRAELGTIKGTGLIPTGSVQSITIDGSETGHAVFQITIKGDRRFKDVEIKLDKTPETGWTVNSFK